MKKFVSVIILCVCLANTANAYLQGKFYYANGTQVYRTSGGEGSFDVYVPYKPNPDYGAPSSDYGWNWNGWNEQYYGGETIHGGDFIFNQLTVNSYHSQYCRTNYYHYFNAATATGVTSKKWVQKKYGYGGSDDVSSVKLPDIVPQSTYGWLPQGWTAADRTYSSSKDILYSSTASKTVYPATSVNQNIRAVYKRTKSLAFDGNGATTGSVTSKTLTQWFVAGKGATGSVTLPTNTFEMVGYTFKGWNTNKSASSGSLEGASVSPDGAWSSSSNQTYYATWEANSYTISYDGNGGDGFTESTPAIYDKDATIADNCFTRLAHEFRGWATSQDGSVIYAPGSKVRNLSSVSGQVVTLYAVWEFVMPQPNVSMSDGTVFCGDSYTVTLSCPLDGATIYYTTNGVTPRLSTTFAYTEPIVIYGSAEIVAIAVKDGERSGYTRVSITQITPDAPVIVPADGTEFRSATCEVTISCATDGAEIYYTIDGSTPQKENGTKYTAPFTIADTTTVKAVSVGGPFKSEVVTATISKRSLSLAEAAGMIELTFDTDENVPWHPIVDVSSATGLAAQSGTIGMNSCTWMETSVRGAGTFSFNWRVDCEKDDSGGATWDRLVAFTNGVEAARIDGVTEWGNVSFIFGDEGKHTIRWEFVKDDYDEEGATFADNAWVSDVSWASADPIPAIEESSELGWALSFAQDKVKLSDKLTSVAAYHTFRNWVDGKVLGHATVAASPNAWLSYALDAPGLILKTTPLASEDVTIDAIVPSSSTSGTFDLVIGIAGAEIGTAARLADVLGVEGATELSESGFSSEGLTVTLQRTTDGKAKAIVTPEGSPASFFLRVKVK